MTGRVSSDWAWLPSNLLHSIVDRLVEVSDFIQFGSVCKPWRSIAQDQSHSHQILLVQLLNICRNKLPMLLTTTSSDNNQRSLYNITDGSVYQIQMPLTCDRRFFGSSQGWLFMVDKPMNMTLINPFLNKIIPLPNLPLKEYDEIDDQHEYFIIKAILLPQNQGAENFEVLMIYSGTHKLAYLNSKDGTWKYGVKDTGGAGLKEKLFSDIISYKDNVYAVSCWSALLRIDNKTGKVDILIGGTNVCAQTTYLVESQDGDLLLIRRFVEVDDQDMHKTVEFEVYKLSWEEGGLANWTRVERIGKQALFLGHNYSMSISTHDFPQCKSNSIYFVDDYVDLSHYISRSDDDSGIYNMEDKSFSRHYIQDPSFCPTLSSIWIVPQLNNRAATH